MSRLDELIAELCPDGVVYLSLGEVADVTAGNSAPQRKSLFENGVYPFVRTADVGKYHRTDNLINVSDYLNDEGVVGLRLFPKGSILFPKSGASTLLNHRAMLGVDAYVVSHLAVIIPQKIDERFLYHFLTMVDAKSLVEDLSYPSLKTSVIAQIKVPVPPLEVQREIVRVLDNFTFLSAELSAELSARRKQYEYYRDSLLVFGEDVPVYKIGDVCTIKGRIGFRGYTQKDFVSAGQGAISLSPGNIVDNHLLFDDCKYITWEKYDESPEIMLSEGDVILCKTGSTVGKVAVVDYLPEKTTLNPQLVVLKNIKCNNRYLFYQLSRNEIQAKIKALAGIGSVPNISQKAISEIEIPVPTYEEQEIIVDTLDRFDTLCNDISNGLPAEIEARRKQYEYYRDKLLTFKELQA